MAVKMDKCVSLPPICGMTADQYRELTRRIANTILEEINGIIRQRLRGETIRTDLGIALSGVCAMSPVSEEALPPGGMPGFVWILYGLDPERGFTTPRRNGGFRHQYVPQAVVCYGEGTGARQLELLDPVFNLVVGRVCSDAWRLVEVASQYEVLAGLIRKFCAMVARTQNSNPFLLPPLFREEEEEE
jgi:hypothetical protein